MFMMAKYRLWRKTRKGSGGEWVGWVSERRTRWLEMVLVTATTPPKKKSDLSPSFIYGIHDNHIILIFSIQQWHLSLCDHALVTLAKDIYPYVSFKSAQPSYIHYLDHSSVATNPFSRLKMALLIQHIWWRPIWSTYIHTPSATSLVRFGISDWSTILSTSTLVNDSGRLSRWTTTSDKKSLYQLIAFCTRNRRLSDTVKTRSAFWIKKTTFIVRLTPSYASSTFIVSDLHDYVHLLLEFNS